MLKREISMRHEECWVDVTSKFGRLKLFRFKSVCSNQRTIRRKTSALGWQQNRSDIDEFSPIVTIHSCFISELL